MTEQKSDKITSVLQEDRSFPPPEAFQSQARIKSMEEYEKLWRYSIDNNEEFWGQQARDLLTWFKPFTKTLDWQEPHAQWFSDGKINASYNCLDRHVEAGLGDKKAIIWEGEPGDTETLTYSQLLAKVCQAPKPPPCS